MQMVLPRTRKRRASRRSGKSASKQKSSVKKYACGCFIVSSERCNAFFVSLCDYHRGEKMNLTTASLKQLADKIQYDEMERKKI